jgi:hypothetical protein
MLMHLVPINVMPGCTGCYTTGLDVRDAILQARMYGIL